jgi:hypothetical protein
VEDSLGPGSPRFMTNGVRSRHYHDSDSEESRRLAPLERAAQRKFAGVRLVQAAYHNRSLCLYTKLGFETRETRSKIHCS